MGDFQHNRIGRVNLFGGSEAGDFGVAVGTCGPPPSREQAGSLAGCGAGVTERPTAALRRVLAVMRQPSRAYPPSRTSEPGTDPPSVWQEVGEAVGGRQLAFEDLEGAAAEIEAAAAPEGPTPAQSPKRPRPARNIGHLPEHLERIEQVIEPESTLCPCGCGEMVKIGEDRTERLDIVPAQLRVIVTVRPKYACRACEQGVTQAPAPARLIEGGLPTKGAIAHALVSKYLDHCPLHRQIYARSGLDLDRSTLAGWVGRASFHLQPVADRLARHLKTSSKLFMDETRAPLLDPGRGRTKTGWLWALARDDRAWGGPDPPGVVYFYAPGRGGEHAERFLDGFDGILQVDGYAGYNRLTGRTRKGGAPIRLAYCWSHARRRLREIYDSSGSEIAAEGLRRIAELYAIEAEIRGSPPEQRLAERQARSAPLVKAFGEWLKQQRIRVSPKSRLGEKLAYIARHWDSLRLFLADGRVEMDSNAVENLARPIALTRKTHSSRVTTKAQPHGAGSLHSARRPG